MAIIGALSSGRTGLSNSGAALAVIGNNIANVGTTGFKGSRTEFSDLISAEGGGQVGKIGLGSRISAVRTLFTQGAIENTGRNLDLAIDGQGFFVLRDGTAQLFTRSGNFQILSDGTITNALGNPLQGNPLNSDGSIAGGPQDIVLGGLNSQASKTATAALNGNIQADSAIIPGGFPGGTPTVAAAYAGSNFPSSLQIYDSLGKAHNMLFFFTRTGTNAWSVNVGVDAGETGGTAGTVNVIGTGTLTYNTDGTVASGGNLTANVTFTGATAQAIAVDLTKLTQYASPSSINENTQDGFGPGGLVRVSVDGKGVVSATFDNGQTRALYQLGIAHFSAPESLQSLGNQLYSATFDSGAPAIGAAQTQGNGSIVSSALEQSNVEIAQEFINLISAQRSFQANARVLSASDQLLSDLVNIVR